MSKSEKHLQKKLSKLHKLSGHPYTFIFIFLSVVGWFVIGYGLHFEESWYKWFHVYEMVITLLMIFIIESTQQADDRAIQEKLDEIIKALPHADNKKINLEKKYKGQK